MAVPVRSHLEARLREAQPPFSFEPEFHEFVGDVPTLVKTVFNPLYTSRGIFLQELILNAIDAVRIRDELDFDLHDYDRDAIHVVIDKRQNVLSVEDAGVGFTKKELISSLGTVGLSGTHAYVRHRPRQPKDEPIPLFGRHGVGFYSALAVSDRVRIVTKSREDLQYIWEATPGSAQFMVDIDRDFRHGRVKCGTKVLCYLNADSLEFIEERTLDPFLELSAHVIDAPVFLLKTRFYNGAECSG